LASLVFLHTFSLEDSGMSIFGASAEPESDLFGDKIVRIVKVGEKSFLDKFNRGDVLVLTTSEEDEMPRECLVVDVGTNWLSVGVGPTWPKGLWETRKVAGGYMVRLDRSVPQSPLHAQRISLSLVRKGRAGHSARQLVTLFCRKTPPPPATTDDCNVSGAKGTTGHTGQEVEKALAQVLQTSAFCLNKSQCDAICWALQREISIIRGPPGESVSGQMEIVSTQALGINFFSYKDYIAYLFFRHWQDESCRLGGGHGDWTQASYSSSRQPVPPSTRRDP
jgi:hypothetical protein